MLVIDSSAALFELVSPAGIDALATANELVAPALLWSEVTSVLHETRWRGEISADLADLALERLCEAAIHRRASADVYRRAWSVADGFGWAKCYDAEFIGLADAVGAPLYTRDARLARRAERLVQILGPDDVRRS
jgi:predicted nucleic acid-binding protein